MLDQPISLQPKMVPRIWGGNRLWELFGRPQSAEPIGESWEVHGELEVSTEPFLGRTLDDLVKEFGPRLLGTRLKNVEAFPLLGKWLDCRDWLSVQVHPDDALARELTGDPLAVGKNEAWYVHSLGAQAELIHGLRENVSLELLKNLKDEQILQYVRKIQPQIGELLFTPAGTVHALGPGALLYEIQQNSNLTYRFYDWGRDRALHPNEAAECASRVKACSHTQNNGSLFCPHFSIEVLREDFSWNLDSSAFEIVVAAGIGGRIMGSFGEHHLSSGESVLLPAGLGELEVNATTEAPLLRIGVPDYHQE